MMKTLSIVASGKVQGVFYRQSTKEKARDLQLTGEVRNLPDDTVLVIATGTEDQLNELIEWCKTGPAKARVTNVEVKELPLRKFEKFNIIR